MNVYLDPLTKSRGINRVKDALIKYLPDGVCVVNTPEEADLEIIHVFGRYNSVLERTRKLRRQKKPYAIIQYCLRSTMRPNTRDWQEIWMHARWVWSYYNLSDLCREDGIEFLGNFYYAPLGVDAELFKDYQEYGKEFVIAASAQHALSESVRECAIATQLVGKKMFHIGHELRRGDDIVCKSNISDRELAKFYSACHFVSGLRRCEGFELPVIEGALCGARPIVFDRPEMRHWFGDFALFIQEGDRGQVIDDLVEIFKEGAQPVTEREKKMIRKKFNWETIINEFWEGLV